MATEKGLVESQFVTQDLFGGGEIEGEDATWAVKTLVVISNSDLSSDLK